MFIAANTVVQVEAASAVKIAVVAPKLSISIGGKNINCSPSLPVSDLQRIMEEELLPQFSRILTNGAGVDDLPEWAVRMIELRYVYRGCKLPAILFILTRQCLRRHLWTHRVRVQTHWVCHQSSPHGWRSTSSGVIYLICICRICYRASCSTRNDSD